MICLRCIFDICLRYNVCIIDGINMDAYICLWITNSDVNITSAINELVVPPSIAISTACVGCTNFAADSHIYMLRIKSFIDQAISHVIHSSMLMVSPSAAAICRWRRTPVNKANVHWHVQCSHVKKSKFKSCWGRWAALSLCPERKTTLRNVFLVVPYDL